MGAPGDRRGDRPAVIDVVPARRSSAAEGDSVTPRLIRTRSLVVALLSVGLLSACSSGGPQPGVAALVGDATIRVNEVNRLTDGFCEAARRDFQSRGDVYPMNVLASVVLQSLAMNSIIDQLAEDYGVEPSDAFAQQAAD